MWTVSTGGCQNYVAGMWTGTRISSESQDSEKRADVQSFNWCIRAFFQILLKSASFLGLQVKKHQNELRGPLLWSHVASVNFDHPDSGKDARCKFLLQENPSGCGKKGSNWKACLCSAVVIGSIPFLCRTELISAWSTRLIHCCTY